MRVLRYKLLCQYILLIDHSLAKSFNLLPPHLPERLQLQAIAHLAKVAQRLLPCHHHPSVQLEPPQVSPPRQVTRKVQLPRRPLVVIVLPQLAARAEGPLVPQQVQNWPQEG